MATNHGHRKAELDYQNSPEYKSRQALRDFRFMPPGAARRAALLAWLLEGRAAGEVRKVFINRRHVILLRHDSDLQRLLKKGVLCRGRENGGRCGVKNKRAGSFSTYLKLAEGYAA